MSAVDVLAVMDRDSEHAAAYRLAHGYADGSLMQPIHEAAEAIAAVAELIERDQRRRVVLATCERWFAQHSPTAPLIGGLGGAEHPMLTMLRDELVRAGCVA